MSSSWRAGRSPWPRISAAPHNSHVNKRPFVTGLVLAAGGSERLGTPKQLLPYGESTLLAHVLATARACDFDQLLCVIGGSAAEIRERVDLSGATVVENHSFGEGCSSSIAAALTAVDEQADALVLMLGDQPGVTATTVRTLIDHRGDAMLAACAYEDGRGHPLAFARATFGELATLHGDKGVWKLLDRHAGDVVDVPIAGAVPRDVDTDQDYRAVLSELEEASAWSFRFSG
jgi:molybdenum cofactor cytidylyltransferase